MRFEYLIAHYIAPLTTVFSNIIVGSVPLIVGWMRYFSTNIKVIGQSKQVDAFYGYSHSLKLENKTLRTFVIDKIKVFVNDEQFFTIDWEKQNSDLEKRTLLPFKQLIVETKWTNALNTQYNSLLLKDGVKFEIRAGDEIITVRYLTFWQKTKRRKLFIGFFVKKNLLCIKNEIGLKRNIYNGEIVSEHVKFAIYLFKNNGDFERTILVKNSGFMNDCIFLNMPEQGNVGINMLPKDKVKSVDSLIHYLKNELFKISQQKFMVKLLA